MHMAEELQPTAYGKELSFRWIWEPLILIAENESLNVKLSGSQNRNRSWVEIKGIIELLLFFYRMPKLASYLF